MQLRCGGVVLGILVFLNSLSVYSNSIEEVFEELKSVPDKYEIKGTVCEQVARLQLAQDYPESKYSIENGIVFSQNRRVLGELDVVVLETAMKKSFLSAKSSVGKMFMVPTKRPPISAINLESI